jgi:hypothetical protein
MIEVRAMSFANEAFSVSRADSGLVVRVITLKPSPWRTEGVQYELATPRLTFSVEGVEGSDRSPSRLVDSVRISDSTVTIYGQRTLPSVGDGLRAHITNLGSYLILDVFVMPGTAVGAITVPLRYQAKISGLAIGPYRLTVRDMPLGGFTALSGYSSLINLRTREELDAGYVGPQ